MMGSHIDTVATGGRYDGALGVLGGLEVIETLNDAGVVTRRPLAVAFFTNEEGARFQPDMFGSLVFTGAMPLEAALATVGIDGEMAGEELDAHRLSRRRRRSANPTSTPMSSCTSSRGRRWRRKASRSARSRACRASRGPNSP